jgi:hypothetical protein
VPSGKTVAIYCILEYSKYIYPEEGIRKKRPNPLPLINGLNKNFSMEGFTMIYNEIRDFYHKK